MVDSRFTRYPDQGIHLHLFDGKFICICVAYNADNPHDVGIFRFVFTSYPYNWVDYIGNIVNVAIATAVLKDIQFIIEIQAVRCDLIEVVKHLLHGVCP